MEARPISLLIPEVLARYGVGPDASARARRLRIVRGVILGVMAVAAVIGVIKVIAGGDAPRPPSAPAGR